MIPFNKFWNNILLIRKSSVCGLYGVQEVPQLGLVVRLGVFFVEGDSIEISLGTIMSTETGLASTGICD